MTPVPSSWSSDAVPSSRNAQPPPDRQPARSEDAETFERLLKDGDRAVPDKDGKKRGARKAKDPDAAPVVAAGQSPLPMPSQSKDNTDRAGRLPSAPAGAMVDQSAATTQSTPAGTATGGEQLAADAALASRFAERLHLPAQAGGQSQLYLDAQHYHVSKAVIGGGADEGLSVAYRQSGSPDRDGNDAADRDSLRQRLEARGLKVADIR